MSFFGRGVAAVGSSIAVWLTFAAAPAYAGRTLQQCVNQSINHNGEPPECTQVNGNWVPSWSGDSGAAGEGIPGGFIFLFVVVFLIGIGITIWKVTTAQQLARQSGMDPGLATQMTLLSDDGLDATYLAASLRRPPAAPAAPGSGLGPPSTSHIPPSSTSERLTQLRLLLDQGLITQAEYDERRRAIIESV